MSINRRRVLGIVGGGTIVAASASAGSFLLTRTPTKALAPWQQAGGYEEPRRRALSYAILAPNPHNRQPWMVDLSQDKKIILYVDTDRLLPHTDPFSRQITIGLGCFLELLVMAAANDGYRASIEEFPQGHDQDRLDGRPVATVSFVKDPAIDKDPLFAHVLERRSLKEPFDLDRDVADSVLQNLSGAARNDTIAGTMNQSAAVSQMRALTHTALAIEIETPRTYKESVDLFRIGKSEINAIPDGISLNGPMIDTLALFGLFTRQTALDTSTSAYKQGVAAVMANIDTAMGYVWLITKTNSRLDQLNAGRDWLRVNLAATKTGVGIHPISQALQEYAEMKEQYEQLHEDLNARGGTVQMLGRLGYAAAVPPSPRWPLDAKIMEA